MKKIGILAVLVTITMSTFAFSDGISVSLSTYRQFISDSKTYTQGTYNQVSYVLDVECYKTSTYSEATITFDWGVSVRLGGTGDCDKTKRGALHNHGSDITLEVLADIHDYNPGSYAGASASVSW